jgi:hypothetical protein
MTYILPRVQIEQEFTQVPVFTEQPLAALIIGPNYQLFRYSEATEKALSAVVHTNGTSLNNYVPGSNTTYSFPNVPLNSTVDQSYVKLFMDNAEGQYLPLAALGSDSSKQVVSKVAGYVNRVSSAVAIFKTTTYSARSSFLSTRDVQPGDICYVNGTISAVPISPARKTKIVKVWPTQAAPKLGAPTYTSGVGVTVADAANANGAAYIAAGFVAIAPLPTITVVNTAYTGTKDMTYKVTITRQGVYYDPTANSGLGNADVCAVAKITSSDTDSSPNVNVQSNTSFNVGSFGLRIKFPTSTSTGLVLGDSWYCDVQAQKDNDANILELQDSINDLDSSGITVTLAVPKASIEIAKIRDAAAGTFNWVTTSTAITVNSAITTTDSGLLNGSIPVNLPVLASKLYVQYRALLNNSSVAIASLSDATGVAAKLGSITPDNALAQGVYNALLNSANVTVYYVGVPSDDLTGYNAALALAKQSDKVYGIVPLTFTRSIQDAVVAHINAMSTSSAAKWRTCWFSSPLVTSKLLYDVKTTGANWVATVADDPIAAGTQYTLVNVTGAKFITDGVRIGDSVLINFTTDSSGNIVYDERLISEVRTEEILIVSSALSSITNAIKVQVRRNYTNDEQIANLAKTGSDFNNRRVRMVFPDTVKNGTVTQNGYFVAAALAGLRSGVVPHQSLTNIELLGFDDTTKSVSTFTQDQLDVLATEGYWIVTQSVAGATPYTRHQLSTDSSGLNFSEDSVTTNVDSISYGLQAVLEPFIGKYNINPTNILLIRSAIEGELRRRATGTFNVRAGNQLNGFNILSIVQNPTFKDRIDVTVELTVPYPMNVIKITLIV